ncbi:MAG: hypothetical protein AAFN12_01365 [Cyanobacteria bacterium J06560_2]
MKQIKLIATVLVLGAIALQIWQMLIPLPTVLQPIAKITLIVLAIHAIEGVIAAALILKYRLSDQDPAPTADTALLIDHLPESTPLAVLKAGLYAFFVGTVGLQEVIKGTRETAKP